jgi:DNA-binding LytR/AlgR family response regulator
MKTRCLIVDDEPLSRDILKKYILEVKDLEILAECHDAFEAMNVLGEGEVDLIFLDIHMPGLSGISMARSLRHPPLIIFTTAYPEFAVEGFELDALDYLVKPFSFERFLIAVQRATERLKEQAEEDNQGRKVIVKSDKKLYALDADEILYLEGLGDYIKIHLSDEQLVVHDTLKDFLASLPGEAFMRIHKSYVVNLEKISFIEGNRVRIGQTEIPVSPASKEELLQKFSAF